MGVEIDAVVNAAAAGPARLSVPDPLIAEAFDRSMHDHVLRCLAPEVFPWYWFICSDRTSWGGTVWPGLDGHQVGHALMWAGHMSEQFGYWDYVKAEQLENGQVPYRIEPDAGTLSRGDYHESYFFGRSKFHSYIPGPYFFTLSPSTWIKHGYDLFRFTQDVDWLHRNFDSLERAAKWLDLLGSKEGLVGCGSYYMDLPTRIEFDGITQGYVYQNYLQISELAERLGLHEHSEHWGNRASRLRDAFRKHFWAGEQCAEYLHPFRGPITSHGLSDVDWIAQAVDLLDGDDDQVLWQRMERSRELYYGILPTGICAHPQNYESWETINPHLASRAGGTSVFRDCAAAGRAWFVEAMARHRRCDGDGLADTLVRVATVGKRTGWNWYERYLRLDMPRGPVREDLERFYPDYRQGVGSNLDDLGCFPVGHQGYAEWPANLVRIACQWLAGVDLTVDGTLSLSPCAPSTYFENGYGLDATLLNRSVHVRYHRDSVRLRVGNGPAWKVRMRLAPWLTSAKVDVTCMANEVSVPVTVNDGWVTWQLPKATGQVVCVLKLVM